MAASLSAYLRESFGAKKRRAGDPPEENMEDPMPPEEETPEEDDPEKEAEDSPPEEEADDPEPDPKAEDQKPGETAKAVRAAVADERKRIVAIISHPRADANPALAAQLIADGTSASKAVAYLGATNGEAANPGLADRMAAYNRTPGPDAPKGAAGGRGGNRLLETARARHSARNPQKGN